MTVDDDLSVGSTGPTPDLDVGAPHDDASPHVEPDALSRLLVLLLKGVVHRETDLAGWARLVELQARARDYLAVIGLDLVIDESEGYAFVRSRQLDDDGDELGVPRLAVRRQLSFPVSVLVALLRRKLAEFDAAGGDTRLVLTRDDLVELIRVFLPERGDEAKLFAQIDAHINKVVDLGFLKRLPATPGLAPSFEVRRMIKAFVDAQWLADLDERLVAYRDALARDIGAPGADPGDHDRDGEP